MATNDHHRDSGHPWDRLEDFDHFDEGDLINDVCLSVNLWVIELIMQLKGEKMEEYYHPILKGHFFRAQPYFDFAGRVLIP